MKNEYQVSILQVDEMSPWYNGSPVFFATEDEAMDYIQNHPNHYLGQYILIHYKKEANGLYKHKGEVIYIEPIKNP